MTDGSTCCNACRLEPSGDSAASAARTAPSAGPVRLEAPTRMAVLFRVANRVVDRIRVFSEDCELDAGGRAVTWIENVRPADSLALLEAFATPTAESRPDRVSEGAVSAIALHADPAADAALERLVAANQPEALRRKIPFWLGNARGARGLEVLRRVLRDDPSTEVRKKAVFGLSQGAGNSGVAELIQTARTDANPAIRGEAIFWLGQKAGSKASAEINDRIDQDPDTEVKKRAVFALSQLPKGEGVPRLIQVARTNPNPAVRKQAMFWLAQSRDQRAIDFFAEILK
jgi:HEAT repeat protein